VITVLQPPPEAPISVPIWMPAVSLGPFSFHTVSSARVPLLLSRNCVPPTATTVFSEEGS